MADSDQVLKVGAEFDVSPLIAGTQQAVTAFNNLGTAAQKSAANFKAAGLSEADSISALRNMGVGLEEASAAVKGLGSAAESTAPEIAAMQEQIAALTVQVAKLDAALRRAQASHSGFNSSAKETRITTDLLTGNVSRAEQAMVRLASSSSVVGGILATAFPVFAAIALIDVLKSMSEAYDKLINSIAGWDAEAQRAYDQIIAQNRKLYISTVETANEINNLNLVGKDGMEKFALAAKDNAENVKAIGEATAVLMRQLAAENDQLAVMQSWDNKIVEALGLGSQEFEDKVKRLQKEIADTTSEIDTLVAKQRNLQTVEPKKNTAEEAAEAIRLSREMREARIEDEKAVATAKVGAEKQAAEQLRAERQTTADQEAIALHIQETELYSIQANAMNAQMELLKSEGSAHLNEVQKIQGQLEALSIEHETKQKEITAKAAEEDRKAYQALAKGLQEDFLRELEKGATEAAEAARKAAEAAKKALDDSLSRDTQTISTGGEQYAKEEQENRQLYDHKLEFLITYERRARELAEEEYAFKVAIYAKEIEAVRDAEAKNVITIEEATNKIKQIYLEEEKAAQEKAQKEKAAQDVVMQEMQKYFTELNTEVNRGLLQWIDGEKTFAQASQQVWQSLANYAIQQILKIGEQWLETHILMKAISEIFGEDDGSAAAAAKKIATNEAEIQSDAGVAAADVFLQAIESIPFPGNLVAAPVLAQTAYTEAIAAAHFDIGGVVPGRVGTPVGATVHGGERVLTPLQNVNLERIANNSTTNNGGKTVHNHTTVQINHNGSNMTHDDMVKAVKIGIRKGQLGRGF